MAFTFVTQQKADSRPVRSQQSGQRSNRSGMQRAYRYMDLSYPVDRQSLFNKDGSLKVEPSMLEDTLEQVAIDRIAGFADYAIKLFGGYTCAISGGKDSLVLRDLVVRAKVPCKFQFANTGIEEMTTYAFMKREAARLRDLGYDYKEMVNYIPEGHPLLQNPDGTYRKSRRWTMKDVIRSGGLPSRYQRRCCAVLKEFSSKNCYLITGVRWSESLRRRDSRFVHEQIAASIKSRKLSSNSEDGAREFFDAKLAQAGLYDEKEKELEKKMAEEAQHVTKDMSDGENTDMFGDAVRSSATQTCMGKNVYAVNPIVDWTDSQIWNYIEKYNLDYNEAYGDIHTGCRSDGKGSQKRCGCVGCVMASRVNREHSFRDNPIIEKMYKNAARYYHEVVRPSKGITSTHYTTFEEYWDYWLDL